MLARVWRSNGVGLRVEIWSTFIRVRRDVTRLPLPNLVASLSRTDYDQLERAPVAELSRAVDRTLKLGARRPRCLVSALVLFRLLRRRGEDAGLVIGLPERAPNHAAHAWVEIAGRDIGPAPGRNDHAELARFP